MSFSFISLWFWVDLLCFFNIDWKLTDCYFILKWLYFLRFAVNSFSYSSNTISFFPFNLFLDFIVIFFMAFFYLLQKLCIVILNTFPNSTIIFTLPWVNQFPEYYFIRIYYSSPPHAVWIFLPLISIVSLPYLVLNLQLLPSKTLRLMA